MDYKEKYETALEHAKSLYNSMFVNNDILEQIFPELGESKDERLRKTTIAFLKEYADKGYENAVECINWLEKQSKQSFNIIWHDITEEPEEMREIFCEWETNDATWHDVVFYHADTKTFWDGELRIDGVVKWAYVDEMFKKQGDIDKASCEIIEKENNVNEETNAPTEYGKYVDERLNEAAKHFFSEGEDKYSVADLFYAGVRCGQSWFEKQGEKPQGKSALEAIQEKPVDNSNKIESKVIFHKGDWVVCDVTGSVYQIKYCVENISNDTYWYGLTNGAYIRYNEVNHYRLWTIQDAKDGDVLASGNGHIILVKESIGSPWGYRLSCHCAVLYDGTFEPRESHVNPEKFFPATKEQRDLLFQKMEEEGYQWNYVKKELVKFDKSNELDGAWCSVIEPNEENFDDVNKVEPKFKVGDWVIDKQNIAHQISNVIKDVTHHTYGYDIVDGGYFNDNIEGIRLWTLRDAKDGDILAASDDSVFIFARISGDTCIHHIALTSDEKLIINYDLKLAWEAAEYAKPATKEQCNKLEKALLRAGYKWNKEKHKLEEA